MLLCFTLGYPGLYLLAKDEADWVLEGREDGCVECVEHFGGELRTVRRDETVGRGKGGGGTGQT